MQKVCTKHNCFLPDNVTNTTLIKLARITDCRKLQALLAQHPSGLLRNALRTNTNLCKAAKRVLDMGAAAPENNADMILPIIKKTRAMLA